MRAPGSFDEPWGSVWPVRALVFRRRGAGRLTPSKPWASGALRATVPAMARRYPLWALRQLREAELERVAERSRECHRALQEAELRAAEAVVARDRALQAQGVERAQVAERLAKGLLRVADLAQADAWEGAARRARTILSTARDRREEEAEAARGQVARSQRDLAATWGQAELVVRDEAAWQAESSRQRLRREDEEAEESWVGRRATVGRD